MSIPPVTARRRVAEAIDIELHRDRKLSGGNWLIVGAILFSSLLVILETEPTVYEAHRSFFFWSELAVLVLFSAEYAARLWSCVENPRFPTRFSWMTSAVAILDLVVIAAIALTLFGFAGSLFPFLRLARLLRIAKLGRFSRAMRNIDDAIRERRNELLLSFFMAGGLLVTSATALYLVEGERQPEVYGSIPRAMWWAVATLTTVGYGDVIPATPLGKFCAALTALTGIGLIAVPAGILASAFGEAMRMAREREDSPEDDGGS